MFKKRFLNSVAVIDPFDPILRYGLFAEGDGEGGEGGGSGEGSAGEGDGGSAGEGAEGAGDGAGEGDEGKKQGEGDVGAGEDNKGADDSADWRSAITDEAAKKFAETSTDVNHLAKRAADLRAQLSKSIIIPGDNATDEEKAAFAEKLGVPESAEGYDWPEIPEGTENVEAIETERKAWGEFFQANMFSKAQAEAAIAEVARQNEANAAQIAKEDEAFAKSEDDALRAEWGNDYKVNKEHATIAATTLLGDEFEAVNSIVMKDGRLLLDSAPMAKMFARLGREMSEGTVNIPANQSDRETIDQRIEENRAAMAKAQAEGNSKKADELYRQEQELIKKRDGARPLVGTEGRAA